MSFFKTNIKSKEIKSLPDEQLVRQILLTQDRIMQEGLYDRYIQKVYHKCLTLVKNKEAAEDITHDVMVKVFSRLSSYQEKSPFYGWIFAITYNQCMDSLNLRKKLHLETYEEYKGDVPDTDDIEQENKVLKELRLGQLEVFF